MLTVWLRFTNASILAYGWPQPPNRKAHTRYVSTSSFPALRLWHLSRPPQLAVRILPTALATQRHLAIHIQRSLIGIKVPGNCKQLAQHISISYIIQTAGISRRAKEQTYHLSCLLTLFRSLRYSTLLLRKIHSEHGLFPLRSQNSTILRPSLFASSLANPNLNRKTGTRTRRLLVACSFNRPLVMHWSSSSRKVEMLLYMMSLISSRGFGPMDWMGRMWTRRKHSSMELWLGNCRP